MLQAKKKPTLFGRAAEVNGGLSEIHPNLVEASLHCPCSYSLVTESLNLKD